MFSAVHRAIGFSVFLVLIFAAFFFPHQSSAQTTIEDKLQITGTVPIGHGSFDHGIRTDVLSPHGQDREIPFEIFYESNLDYDIKNAVIVAQWDPGVIEGTGNAVVTIVEYLPNSAEWVDGITPPIIDPIHNTITWKLPTIPANEYGSISFTLKTTDNYTGPSPVLFDVKGKMMFSGYNKQKSTTQEYRYIKPKPGPTPTDSPRPTSSTTPAPSPTPIPEPLTIEDVQLSSLTNDTANIHAIISDYGSVDLLYGTNPNDLSQTLKSLKNSKEHFFEIAGLSEDTIYYFKIIGTANGKTVSSDIYTFNTPLESEVPKVIEESIIITSRNHSIQNSKVAKKADSNVVIIPMREEFSLMFELENGENIKSVSVVREERVLGINTVRAKTLEVNETKAVEIMPGLFIAKHLSPLHTGISDLYAVIKDHNGNIVEKKLTELRTVEPIKVINADTKESLELAKISLYHFNSKTNIYEFIDPYLFDIPNPDYTLADGTMDIVLPIGKYKAVVEEIGFYTKEVEFEIHADSGITYPLIELEHRGFSIISSIRYHAAALYKDMEEFDAFIAEEFSPRRLKSYIHFQFSISLILVLAYTGLRIFIKEGKYTKQIRDHKNATVFVFINGLYKRITELSLFISAILLLFAVHELGFQAVVIHLLLWPLITKLWIRVAYSYGKEDKK